MLGILVQEARAAGVEELVYKLGECLRTRRESRIPIDWFYLIHRDMVLWQLLVLN